jgi:hypothetical protein
MSDRFSFPSDNLRGAVIGLRGPQGLCDISWKVVSQSGAGRHRRLSEGIVTLENLTTGEKHSRRFSDLRKEMEEGLLKIVDLN